MVKGVQCVDQGIGPLIGPSKSVNLDVSFWITVPLIHVTHLVQGLQVCPSERLQLFARVLPRARHWRLY